MPAMYTSSAAASAPQVRRGRPSFTTRQAVDVVGGGDQRPRQLAGFGCGERVAGAQLVHDDVPLHPAVGPLHAGDAHVHVRLVPVAGAVLDHPTLAVIGPEGYRGVHVGPRVGRPAQCPRGWNIPPWVSVAVCADQTQTQWIVEGTSCSNRLHA